jgi:hypothetical protein
VSSSLRPKSVELSEMPESSCDRRTIDNGAQREVVREIRPNCAAAVDTLGQLAIYTRVQRRGTASDGRSCVEADDEGLVGGAIRRRRCS